MPQRRVRRRETGRSWVSAVMARSRSRMRRRATWNSTGEPRVEEIVLGRRAQNDLRRAHELGTGPNTPHDFIDEIGVSPEIDP